VNGPPSDLHIKKRAASCERLTAPFSKQESRNDFEVFRPSFVKIPSFQPGAQSRFPEFIPPEIPPDPIFDGYGLGNPSLPRIEGKSEPAQIEQEPVERALVHNDSKSTSAQHGCPSELEKGESKSGFTGKSKKPKKKFTEAEVHEFEKDAVEDVTRRATAHRSIAQRYEDRDFICSLIKDSHPLEYEKLRWCGDDIVIKRRRYCGRYEGWSIIHGCGLRICPFCSRARANAKFRNIWPVVWAYAQRHTYLLPCSIVLTYSDDTVEWAELTQRQKIKRTQKALGKLLRRLEFKQHISAGIWSIENTKNSSGNDHMHVHLVVFRRASWANEYIAALWSEVTDGIGGFTYIKAQSDLRSSLQHTLKYALKPASTKDWTAQDAIEFMACKGLRLTTRFGGLYNFKLTESEEERLAALESEYDAVDPICPSCGREDEWVLDTLCVGRTAVRKELGDRHGDWAILNIIRSREARAP